MTNRRRSDGLRKVCRCLPRVWAKCAHPWHLTFRWQGTRYRFSLDRHVGRPVTSKTEAERIRDEVRAHIRAGTFRLGRATISPLTVDDLLRAYLATRTPEARTREAWHRTVTSRCIVDERAFGTFLLSDVTTGAVERFRAARLAQPRQVMVKGALVERPTGRIAVNRNVRMLRAAWNWALLLDAVSSTPFVRHGKAAVKLPKEAARHRRLQPGEYERLLPACGTHLRAMVEAAIESGCRRGELLSLQWSQVTLTGRATLFLPAAKTKTRTDRWVPVSTRLRAVLELRRYAPDGELHPPEAYVFGNECGELVKSIKTAWGLTCRRAQITGLHFHDLRREAGSRWLDGRVPLSTIRDWLGHTNIAQTSTYLAAALQGSHDEMARFEQGQAGILGKHWANKQPGRSQSTKARTAVSH